MQVFVVVLVLIKTSQSFAFVQTTCCLVHLSDDIIGYLTDALCSSWINLIRVNFGGILKLIEQNIMQHGDRVFFLNPLVFLKL